MLGELIMTDQKGKQFEDSSHLLDEEDEATIELLKQRIQSSKESRLIPAEEVYQRIKERLSRSR